MEASLNGFWRLFLFTGNLWALVDIHPLFGCYKLVNTYSSVEIAAYNKVVQPFHSTITAFIIFIPIFALYHKDALPYFIALIQHSLLGDFIAGGRVQLLWPLTTQTFGIGVSIKSITNMTLEWLLFTATIITMMKTNTNAIFQPRSSNLVLAIPTFTVLLPTFLSFPLQVPIPLIPPHIICLTIFLTSLLIDVKKIVNQTLSKRLESSLK